MSAPILTLLNPLMTKKYYDARSWQDASIYDSFLKFAQSKPSKTAIRNRYKTYSYADINACVIRLADYLHTSGLSAGERVAVWLPSRIETAIALLACSRNGYICCPSLHRDHTVGEIKDLIIRMQASAVIAEDGYGADTHRYSIFQEIEDVAHIKAIIKLDPLTEKNATEEIFTSLPPAGARSPHISDADAIVYLAFTSGTTGLPKGVMHSNNTLLANARSMANDWSINDQSIIYSFSPLSHNLGFGAMIMTLSHGGQFVIHDLKRGKSFVDQMINVGATFAIGVPTHAIDLLNELKQRNLKSIGQLMGFRISGASVPPVIAAGLLEHGVKPQSGYGMTEAGSHHYTLPNDDPAMIIETSGKACSSYEACIFSSDDMNKKLPAGEVGQIGGRGASLMLGYFADQTATQNSFNRDGWFMTGDLGWMDDKGYIRITGRKKDVIIRGGHNIYPAKIESLVMRHTSIAHAAAVPIADDRLGEKVCLVVTTKTSDTLNPDDMLRHLDEVGLSKFDMPEFYLQIDKLPLTPSGKILKRVIVDDIRDGKINPVPVRFKAS